MEKQLPKNWIKISIVDFAEIVKSKGEEDIIPYLEIGDVNTSNKDYELKEKPSVKGCKTSKINDVLISKVRPTRGAITITKHEELSVSSAFTILRFKELTTSKIVFYQLAYNKTFYDYLGDNCTGTMYPTVSEEIIKEYKINIPPLPEQNRIVTKLDALFEQLETIKSSMANVPLLLKDFRLQVLTQAVTGKLTEEWRKGKKLESFDIIDDCQQKHWSLKEFQKYNKEILNLNLYTRFDSWTLTCPGVLCEKIVDGTHKTPKYIETGVKFLSAKNIKNGIISFDGCKYISIEEHKELIKRCNPKIGSLLITKSGTIGRMAIVDIQPDFSLFESVAVLTPISKKINSKFLGYSINHYLVNGGNEKHVKGTAVQHLHLDQLRILPIDLPSTKEQQEIVTRVESLFAKADAIEKQYENLKAKIDNLPQALLHKAFKGELTEQLDNDGDARELLNEIEALKALSFKAVKGKSLKIASKKVKGYGKNEEILRVVVED